MAQPRALATFRAVTLGACLIFAQGSTSEAFAKKPAAERSAGAEATFLGYQTLADGSGLLFVELSQAVKVEMNRAGPIVEYKLVDTSVPLRNNRNPLLLRDFASSALSAVLVASPRGKGRAKQAETSSVRLIVTLRSNVQPSHRVVNRGKGARLEIELPKPR